MLRCFAYHTSWLFLLVIKSSNLIIQKKHRNKFKDIHNRVRYTYLSNSMIDYMSEKYVLLSCGSPGKGVLSCLLFSSKRQLIN